MERLSKCNYNLVIGQISHCLSVNFGYFLMDKEIIVQNPEIN